MQQYHGQFLQDFIADTYFEGKQGGTYVDIGAFDGASLSNTLHFEKNRNWTGICVEPNISLFQKLLINRPKSHKFNCLVGSSYQPTANFVKIEGHETMLSGNPAFYHPTHLERITKSIGQLPPPTPIIQLTFNQIAKRTFPHTTHFDLLSIDTEGSELDILLGIDWKKYSFGLIMVENPYATTHNNPIKSLLIDKGYLFVGEIIHDDVFIHPHNQRTLAITYKHNDKDNDNKQFIVKCTHDDPYSVAFSINIPDEVAAGGQQ